MQVLFCHDGPLTKDELNNYYGVAHNNDTFCRYYAIADELAVAIRIREITKVKAEKSLSKITVSPFKVIECPDMSNFKGMLFNKQKVSRIITKAVEDADYIVARLPSIIGLFAIDAAKKLKKPYLVEVVACPWDALWNHSLKGKVVAPYMYFATKKRIKEAPFVLYVTNKFLQQRYPCHGRTIGCSDVDLQSIDDSILKKRLNKIQQMNKNNPVILGTIAAVNVRYKGQKYVIKAISKLNKQGYNFEYHLVGGGDNKYLKSIAVKYNVIDKVKFIGVLPHDEVFNFLDNIDIYIQPSKQEGLPRALVEAMSHGCPSLGSNIGGIPELIKSEYIFSNGSVSEICKLLKKMDKEEMKKEAKIVFEKAKEYSKELLDKKRFKFYKEFVFSIESRN